MIEHGGDQNPGDDRNRPAKARGQQQREQLGLVADLGNRHRKGGYQQSLQEAPQNRGLTARQLSVTLRFGVSGLRGGGRWRAQ